MAPGAILLEIVQFVKNLDFKPPEIKGELNCYLLHKYIFIIISVLVFCTGVRQKKLYRATNVTKITKLDNLYQIMDFTPHPAPVKKTSQLSF